MTNPKGFILYRIWYGKCIAYLGRTKQPLADRIRGHMFAAPMHRAIDIHNVTRIEYTILSTEADMNLYEIYLINLWKPPLNVDDKAKDGLTITLPELEWKEFRPSRWKEWMVKLDGVELLGGYKAKNERIMIICPYCGKVQCACKSIAHEMGLSDCGHGTCLKCKGFMRLKFNEDSQEMIAEKWEIGKRGVKVDE